MKFLPEKSEIATLDLDGYKVVLALIHATPEWAAKVLEQANTNNWRQLRKSTAERYAEAMASHSWDFNGETIKFDWSGNLLDGQHRLEGIVISGVAQYMLAVVGIKSDRNIDEGDKRSFAQYLVSKKEKNATTLAGTVNRLRLHYEGKMHYGSCPSAASRDVLVSILSDNERIRESVTFCMHRVRDTYLTACDGALLHYLFGKKDGRDSHLADQFFDKFSTGVNLSPDDAVFRLRSALVVSPRDKSKPRPNYVRALTIIAWNTWKASKPCKVLRWVEVGPGAQPFPTID